MGDEKGRVLVIDDEAAMRHMLRLVLEKEGYGVEEAPGGSEGLAALAGGSFEVVLCDIRMPGMDGLAFLEQAAKAGPLPTVIMMSAYGSIDTAVECMKRGAYDFISKPFKPDEILLTLGKAGERRRLQAENQRLRRVLNKEIGPEGIVFRSPAMAEVLDMVKKVAHSPSAVLITGETGTGKELIARALHSESPRRGAPFVAVNCGAISSGLMESELFGHVRGAFTGADRERQGLFSAASGGTLFLDEIGELPLDLQPKLLRVLQEGEVRRVGETKPRKVDVRVVTATARDLKAEAEAGRFREDLFYRLDVVQVRLPPPAGAQGGHPSARRALRAPSRRTRRAPGAGHRPGGRRGAQELPLAGQRPGARELHGEDPDLLPRRGDRPPLPSLGGAPEQPRGARQFLPQAGHGASRAGVYEKSPRRHGGQPHPRRPPAGDQPPGPALQNEGLRDRINSWALKSLREQL